MSVRGMAPTPRATAGRHLSALGRVVSPHRTGDAGCHAVERDITAVVGQVAREPPPRRVRKATSVGRQ